MNNITIVDKNYKYVAVSGEYLSRRGVFRSDIIGKSLEMVWGKETWKNKIKPFFEKALEGKSTMNEVRFTFSGKTKKHYRTKYIPLFEKDGKINKILIITDDLTKEKQIKKEITTDHLTGCLNKKQFQKDMAEIVRLKMSFCLMIIDIDKFKQINDTLGHAKGDEILKRISSHIKSTFRKTDKIYRIGGDEFAVIANLTSNEIIQERIKKLSTKTQKTTISIGYQIIDKFDQSPQQIFKRVDAKMYKNKGQ